MNSLLYDVLLFILMIIAAVYAVRRYLVPELDADLAIRLAEKNFLEKGIDSARQDVLVLKASDAARQEEYARIAAAVSQWAAFVEQERRERKRIFREREMQIKNRVYEQRCAQNMVYERQALLKSAFAKAMEHVHEKYRDESKRLQYLEKVITRD